jgi:subtilisin family serine protease
MGSAAAAKIEPWVMENTRAGAQAEFFVVLEKQADLAAAAKLESKLSKGTFVYQTLFKTAQEAQKPIRALLDARGVEYRPFYLVNAILVKGDRNLAQRLAARPDVRRIDGNPEMRQALPEPEPLEADSEGPDVLTGKAIQTAEPGINYVRAPQVWSLGYTGQGVVVAGADTGYRWTHAALKKAYRGWNGTTANHDYNWHDAIHHGTGLAGATLPSRATTSATALTPWAPSSGSRAPTRSAWRRARGGSAAGTWTRATARPPATSNAWSSSWRPTRCAATPVRAIRARLHM